MSAALPGMSNGTPKPDASAALRDRLGEGANRVALLTSGNGSTLQALVERDVPVSVVIVDCPCGAVQVAKANGIPVEVIRYGVVFYGARYSRRLSETLFRHGIDTLVVAGFNSPLDPPLEDVPLGRFLRVISSDAASLGQV